jgi:hypothetical protein
VRRQVHRRILNLRFLGGFGDRVAEGASEYCRLNSRESAAILLLLRATRPTRAGNLYDVVSNRDAAAAGSCSIATCDGANLAKARDEDAMTPN